MTLTTVERAVAFEAPPELVEAREVVVRDLITTGSDPLGEIEQKDVQHYAQVAGDYVTNLTLAELDPDTRVDLLDARGLYHLGGPIVTRALHAERFSRTMIAEQALDPAESWLQSRLHAIRIRRQTFRSTLGMDAVDLPDDLTPWIDQINTKSSTIRTLAAFSPVVGSSVELALLKEFGVTQPKHTELLAA